jgi:AbrB family looped-hinge helix DNA binding protein
MRIAIDSAGRLVLPKEVRRLAGIEPGMELELRFQEGRIEIEPAPIPVKLVRRKGFLVAVPERSIPKLTGEVVERTREELRRNRAG